jgi:hypothetical protein
MKKILLIGLIINSCFGQKSLIDESVNKELIKEFKNTECEIVKIKEDRIVEDRAYSNIYFKNKKTKKCMKKTKERYFELMNKRK